MLPPVFGRRIKLISLLLLMAFVFGMGSCVLACADADHSPDADAPQHCVCHTLAVTPSSSQLVWFPPLSQLVVDDATLNLPLLAASIFQPPKA